MSGDSSERAGSSRHNIVANLLLSVLGTAVGIGGQLLSVPVFLRSWGESVYGDWLTLSALAAYLALTDAGMQLYVVNRLTAEEVREQTDGFLKTLHSALLLYLTASCIAITGLLGVVYLLPWKVWFTGRAIAAEIVRPTVLLLGAGVIAAVWCGFAASLHRAHGRAHRTTAIGVVTRTASLVATISALLFGLNILELAALQLCVPVLCLIWSVFDYRRLYRRPILSLKHAEWRVARSMIAPSGLFALVSMANGIVIQGSILVVSSMLGPLAVTTFATSRTLANTVRQGVALLHSVAWPEFTRLQARGADTALSSAHRLLVKLSAVSALWVVCSLWFNLHEIFQIWTGKQSSFNQPLLRLLLIHALLQTPWWTSAVLLTATNHHRRLAYLFVAQGILTLAVTPVAVHFLGVTGIGAAALLIDIPVFAYLVPAWSQEMLGEERARYFPDIYGGLAVILSAMLVITWLLNMVTPAGFVAVPITIAVTSVPAAIGGLLWLRPDERALATMAIAKQLVRFRRAPSVS
ncbi:MAG: hypothetical protein JWN04_758 [Myxococcaceae bacterium]|nr:hypothetical protein [Myxococcaceae bacterium]